MKILIEVENGIVTNVYCSEPEGIEILVIDADVEVRDDVLIDNPDYAFLVADKYEVY